MLYFVSVLFSCVHCDCSSLDLCVFVGLDEFADSVGSRLSARGKGKKYSSRNVLHRRMLSLHPAFPHFVSGAKNGKGTHFHCRVCKRDVGMRAQGSGEFARHFQSDGHWFKDVTYRVHMGLPVLNRLMEPMELSESQLAEYRSKAFEDLSEGYPFPEDLLPKHSRVESKVPFMTLVGCVCELLCSGGDFVLLRRLWSHFLLTLPKEKGPQFNLNWSRSETVMSMCLFVL